MRLETKTRTVSATKTVTITIAAVAAVVTAAALITSQLNSNTQSTATAVESSAVDSIIGDDLDYLRYAIRGDFNGDDYPDVAVCSNSFGRSGLVHIFLGASGTEAVSGNMIVSTADVIISTDATTTSYFTGGACVSGDVNDDGIDDIIIGSYDNDDAGTDTGAIHVVPGSSSLASSTLSSAIQFTGEVAHDYAGYRVAVGDVTGDGIDDIIVGAPNNDDNGSSSGAVYVVPGSSSLASSSFSSAIQITGADADDAAGAAVATGDVNGDGIDDIIIGAMADDVTGNDAGAVYVVPGSSSLANSWLSSAIQITGEAADNLAGAAVATGDVNGDGIDDIIVGAYANNDAGSRAGAVYVVPGSSSLSSSSLSSATQFTGEAVDDVAGSALATGDLNGDGMDDIIIGADVEAGSLGSVYVVLGRSTWIHITTSLTPGVKIRKFIGETPSEAFGDSVGYFESVNMGTFSPVISPKKLVLGAWLNIDNGVGTGKIWLIDTLPGRSEGYQRIVR